MTNPILQTSATVPVKKVWSNPELTLISQNEVHGGAQPSMKEINFSPFPSTPGRFYYNKPGTANQFTYDHVIHS
jgi:hypothetical protein